MTSVHTVARDLLVGAFQDASVAAIASVGHSSWVGRILTGDRDGYIGELHRGRLPAVEIMEEPGERWDAPALDLGTVQHSWRIRIHVGGFSQVTGEELARAILYAGLIVARALNYFKIGGDTVGIFNSTALGYSLETVITCTNSMDRGDYETAPAGTVVPPTSGGDVGGISLTINYNATSPVAILALPADAAIDNVAVQVVTPFNGTAPTVTIGVDGEQGRYLAGNESDISVASSVWEKDANDIGPKTVKVWLAPGGSTAGSIKVQISVTNA